MNYASEAKFIFTGYKENIENGEVEFNYVLERNGKITNFSEKILFPVVSTPIPKAILTSILNNLMLILGISYWKLYCPKDIQIENFYLTKEQAKFWNTVYTKGLGEFFYENKIDFRGLIQFPYSLEKEIKLISVNRQDRCLLPIGGGKDSIVSVELLKQHKIDCDLLVVGESQIQTDVCLQINKKQIVIRRELDPKLFGLNKQDGFNGHIPVSAIYAFLTVFAAIVYDYRYIIVSNEKSANFGNVSYLGQEINHQWSKSVEFEKMFKDYVRQYIVTDVEYFSLLRPFTELKIAQMFCKYSQYFSLFSSCNTNFKINSNSLEYQTLVNHKWCAKCSKCAFVFAMLAAFLSKKEIIKIFGENLFDDISLIHFYKELLGIEKFKPFECVGTPSEMKQALYLIYQKNDFNDSLVMQLFIKEILPGLENNDELLMIDKNEQVLIPEKFIQIISNL